MCGVQDEDDLKLEILLTIVFLHGFINLLIRGTELLLAIISTSFILVPLFSGNSLGFSSYLGDEAHRVLWRGPYPQNFSIHGTTGKALIETTGEIPRNQIPSVPILLESVQLRISLSVWGGHLLWKIIIFVYGSLLILSAKRKSYSLSLAWLAFSVPFFCQNLLHFFLDLLTIDFFQRPVQSQVLQSLDISFQFLGIVIISFYLRSLYLREEEIAEIDRYNNNIYKTSRSNSNHDVLQIDGITIRPLNSSEMTPDESQSQNGKERC